MEKNRLFIPRDFLFNGSIIENIVMGKRQTTELKINVLQFDKF